MSEAKIDTEDLETLLDIAEGFISENGIRAADKYAPPERIEAAVNKARKAVRNAKALTIHSQGVK